MAPSVGQGSKNKGKLQSSRDNRRSRSRNTTPTSSVSASVSLSTAQENISNTYPPYLQTPLNPAAAFSDTAIEDILNSSNGGGSSNISNAASLAANPNPPSAAALKAIGDTISSQLCAPITQRGETCEKLLRELAHKRKDRTERDRVREQDRSREKERERQRERDQKDKERERERAEQRESEGAGRNGNGNGKLKKSASSSSGRGQEGETSEKSPVDEKERPMAVGAHGVARQDGVDVHKAESQSPLSSPAASHPPPSIPDTNTKIEKQEPTSPTSTTGEHQPPPAAPIQQYQFFGEDPSTFPDSTIYHIREVTPDMTDDDKREIYSVAVFPESDLHDQTCGTPPDRDFSNARPANQIAATTFANFIEPYVRPLTEEDKAFLLERGDREKPFIMPKRGPRHYKDIWKEEDDGMADIPMTDSEPKNEARGDMDLMNDDVAESEEVSTGPVLSRLLSIMRYQGKENGETDASLTNGHNDMEIDEPDQPNGLTTTISNSDHPSQPPATLMPDWKNAPTVPKTDYVAMDDRLLQELRYMGFLSPTQTPDYDAEQDDEVAARLRYLQAELRRVSILNGARKARLLDMTEDRIAAQEWSGIAEDLDTQLNQAYMKRNRNISKKGNKVKKPGTAAPIGVAAAAGSGGVGEPLRQLMERRMQWREWVGKVVDFGVVKIPDGSIFDDGQLDPYILKEQEGYGEVEDV